MYCGSVVNRIGGAPLAGISVSDGRNVTKTDENGRFSLEGWERAHFIYLNILTETDHDWYIKIDGHEGDFDFSVTPYKSGSEVCFLHTSDTEIENIPFVGWLPFFREKAEEHKADFFINTGDICRDYGMMRHRLIMNKETLGCPVRYAIGNHDFTGKNYGEESFEEYYGPVWYSFECGGVHFAVTSIGKGEKPTGFEPDDQWKWLVNDLANKSEGTKLVIFNHTLCPGDERLHRINVGEVDVDLREHDLIAWIYGHYHQNSAVMHNGVLNVCTACPDSGGIDSSPAGIRKFTVSDGKPETEMLYYRNETLPACKPIWCTQLDGISEFSSPVLFDGDVIVATVDDGYPKKCGVYRIDGESGDVVWSFATENGVKNDIAVDDVNVYVMDEEGKVYCLCAEDGTLVWKKEITFARSVYTRSNVLLCGDTVVCGTPIHIWGFDKKSGDTLWDFDKTRSEATPAKFIYDKEREQLLISRHWNEILALDVNTREEKWVNNENRFRTETPVVVDGVIYTCGLRQIYTLDAASGKTLVRVSAPTCMDVCGAPFVDGDTVYYPSAQCGVYAVDRKKLEVKRRYECGCASIITSPYRVGKVQMVETSPIVKGDTLIFAANDGCVYFYDKNTAELIKKISVGAAIIAQPIYADDSFITIDFDGKISKYSY